MAQLVKNLPAMLETWVQSLGWEYLLENGKATHSIFWPGEFHGNYNLWDCTEFFKFAGILSAALSQHHLSGFEIAQLEFHHLT